MENKNQEIVIQLKNLTKKFGNLHAVKNVNLDIYRGEIVGFLGPNGAGKTTTIKMMAFLLKPDEGDVFIRINGELQKLTNGNKHHLMDKIGFLIELPSFYKNVTPRKILSYFAKLKGYPRNQIAKRIDTVLQMVGMLEWKDKKIGTFSKGMKQKIGLASSIIHDPDVLVLDEPQTGLDPSARKEMREILLDFKQTGKTIFLSSHLIYEISEIAEKIAIINRGQLVAFDTMANLKKKPKRSIVFFEISNPPEDNIEEYIEQLKDTLMPLTGIKEEENWIKYDKKSRKFRMSFNGKEDNQIKILRKLHDEGYQILEYTTSKVDLLEKLFIKLTKSNKDGGVFEQ